MDDALRIAHASGLPYAGLRGFTPAPRLWRYVPLAFALEHGVVPVMVIGDVLHVAAAAPDVDLSPLAARFPKLGFAVTIAPAREIFAALERAQAGG